MNHTGYSLRIIRSPADIEAATEEWRQLVLADPTATPFQLPEMVLPLHLLQHDPGSPYIATLRATNGSLKALLPLQLRTSGVGLSRTTLSAMTGWHASFFSGVTAADTPNGLERLISMLQQRSDWDLCDLRFVRENTPLLHALQPQTIRHGVAMVIAPLATSGTSFSSRKLAVERRRIERQGTMVFTASEPPDRLAEVASVLGQFHSERWSATPDALEFHTPGRVALLAGMLASLGSALRAGTLRLDGKILAVHIAVRHHSAQYCWRVGHDSAFRLRSPGRILYEAMIRQAMTEGCDRYELGRGEEPYKQKWEPTSIPLHRAALRSRSWRAELSRFRASISSTMNSSTDQ